MDFHAGDTVMHWAHGLGTVIRRERREVLGHKALTMQSVFGPWSCGYRSTN